MTSRNLLLALSVLVAASPAFGQRSPSQSARRTPVVEVFERTSDAVVNITATQSVESTVPFSIFDEFFGMTPRRPQTRRYERTSLGSGFLIHPDGYVVTNAHVLMQGAVHRVIFADQTEYEAVPVAVDEQHDLAVIKIKDEGPFPSITLGRSDDLMIGETVIAIGNPLGYQHTVTSGIVSAVNRTLQISQSSRYEGLIQTDASINRGNSGGPLLNILGELIGINTAIRGDAQNIGFAIPVDTLRKLLPDMLSIERRGPRLEIGLRLSWRDSVRVVEVRGPAAAAGVDAGDELISVDGQPIKHDVDFYIHLLRIQPEDRLVLELRRNGRPVTAVIQPRPIPIPDGGELLRDRFGMTVRLLTPEQASELDLKGGLIVTQVEPGSPAHQAGFHPGLVVVQIGRSFPTDLGEVGSLLEHVRPGDRVPFRLWRIQRDFIRVYAVALTAR